MTLVKPMGLRERQRADVRKRLYNKALESFRKHGFGACTVQGITEAVGVSKGTFFNYFPTKEHVLAEYFDRLTRAVLNEVADRPQASGIDAILDLHLSLARRATDEPDLLVEVARHVLHNPTLASTETDLDRELIEWQRGRVETAIEVGDLDGDLNVDLFLSMVMVTLTGTAHEWVVADRSFDLPATLEERIGFLMRAARRSHR